MLEVDNCVCAVITMLKTHQNSPVIILPDKAKQLLEASSCITKVPDCLAGWEDDFQVPLQYSTATMVNFGKIA